MMRFQVVPRKRTRPYLAFLHSYFQPAISLLLAASTGTTFFVCPGRTTGQHSPTYGWLRCAFWFHFNAKRGSPKDNLTCRGSGKDRTGKECLGSHRWLTCSNFPENLQTVEGGRIVQLGRTCQDQEVICFDCTTTFKVWPPALLQLLCIFWEERWKEFFNVCFLERFPGNGFPVCWCSFGQLAFLSFFLSFFLSGFWVDPAPGDAQSSRRLRPVSRLHQERSPTKATRQRKAKRSLKTAVS